MNSSFGLLRPPGCILFGSGMVDAVGSMASEHGEQALLCTDSYLATAPQGQAVIQRLCDAGLEVTVLDAAEAELPLASVVSAITEARKSKVDVIVGLGGGSCLDLAKLVALGVSSDRPLHEYYGENGPIGDLPPLIALPTTAGTGSEVTPVAVLDDPSRAMKVGISSHKLIPTVAICDPVLTHGAPPVLTANAGIDALAHAIEAYTAVQRNGWAEIKGRVFVGRNFLSDHFALQAIELLAANLERAVADDPAAREGALAGSLCAGLAFATAGTALAHALQYPIGARTGTPHGMGVGLMLPHVMRYNASAVEDRLGAVGKALGTGSDPEAAVERVLALSASLGLPSTLSEMGLEEDAFEEVATSALSIDRLISNNPEVATQEGLMSLLTDAQAGDKTGA